MGDEASNWRTPEMLDLDGSDSLIGHDEEDEEEEEGEIALQPPSSCEFAAVLSAAPTCSPAKMERSSSPTYLAEVAVPPPTAPAYSQDAVDMPTSRLSSRVVVQGAAPFSLPAAARSSSGSSPSRAHAKGTSDTSSSQLSRRLRRPFVRRDEATSKDPAQPYHHNREPPRVQFPVENSLARRLEVDRGYGPEQKKHKNDERKLHDRSSSPQDDRLPQRKQYKNWIPRAKRTRENWCDYHNDGIHGTAQCRRLKQIIQKIKPKALLREVIQIEGEPDRAISDGPNSYSC
ncbi:hypothetical protein ZWY2020_044194 [Hordeum vulgare]|nr:hypothetical protein ZWY2020_005381 [Hordeum vulgare]KAI5019306.1 hypothetical protein ZWY2020_044194 [Hordeum vulgare]